MTQWTKIPHELDLLIQCLGQIAYTTANIVDQNILLRAVGILQQKRLDESGQLTASHDGKYRVAVYDDLPLEDFIKRPAEYYEFDTSEQAAEFNKAYRRKPLS